MAGTQLAPCPARSRTPPGRHLLLYADGILPFLLPLSVFLIEPTKRQRNACSAFVILGGLFALYLNWGLIAYPLQVFEQSHSIVYINVITNTTLVALLYVIATCGALFFSGYRPLVELGWFNLVGLIVVALVKRYAFTSVWCAYAAVVSVMIYFFFVAPASPGWPGMPCRFEGRPPPLQTAGHSHGLLCCHPRVGVRRPLTLASWLG